MHCGKWPFALFLESGRSPSSYFPHAVSPLPYRVWLAISRMAIPIGKLFPYRQKLPRKAAKNAMARKMLCVFCVAFQGARKMARGVLCHPARARMVRTPQKKPNPKTKNMKLLSVDTNAKTKKGQSKGYLTGILYLAPADMAITGKNLCPHASNGCKAACLFSAGRGAFDSVKNARVRKTLEFFKNRDAFVEDLKKDISALVKKAKKAGMNPCVRLNGTSDIPWHKLGIIQDFPEIPFYDYTPNKGRMLEFLAGKLPANYSLTFSRKENNQAECEEIITRGGNVAAVFKEIPQEWNGKPCFDGDKSDLRFLDPKGVIVALKAKGKAKKDKSGFVI